MANSDMMECTNCGCLATRGTVDGEYQVRTIKGRHLGHPDADSEDEYVSECPDCGARESFKVEK